MKRSIPRVGRATPGRPEHWRVVQSARSRAGGGARYRPSPIPLQEKDKPLLRLRFVRPQPEWRNASGGYRLECSEAVLEMAANMVCNKIPDQPRTGSAA